MLAHFPPLLYTGKREGLSILRLLIVGLGTASLLSQRSSFPRVWRLGGKALLLRQLETDAQSTVFGLPLVGYPDEGTALGGAGDVFSDAGTGIQHAFRLLRVTDIDDAQGVAHAFRKPSEAVDAGGFIAGQCFVTL